MPTALLANPSLPERVEMATKTMSMEEILEAIGTMSVTELADLIEAFKEKFNVTIAAAPVAAAPAVAASTTDLVDCPRSRNLLAEQPKSRNTPQRSSPHLPPILRQVAARPQPVPNTPECRQ